MAPPDITRLQQLKSSVAAAEALMLAIRKDPTRYDELIVQRDAVRAAVNALAGYEAELKRNATA